jgi:hypothetical protein
MDPSENQCCGSGIRDPVFFVLLWHLDPDPGWGKNGYGMNIPVHISERFEKFFMVKILKFLYTDPRSGIFLTLEWIRDGKISGSGTNIADP